MAKDKNGIQITEQTIRGQGGSIVVKSENGSISLELPSGMKRTFTFEKLEQTRAGLELLKDYEGIWIEVTDSNNKPLAVSFNTGRAFLETAPKAKADYSVSWNLLEKALDKAVAEHEAEQQSGTSATN